MNDSAQRLSDLLVPGRQALVTVIDILLVTYLIFRLLKLIRGTRAWRVVGGVTVLIAAFILSDFFGLRTLHWILQEATTLAPVALAILFLPELRQAMEGFARLGLWPDRFMTEKDALGGDALEEIVAASAEMAELRTGALIVIERVSQLDDIVENGIPVHAQVTAALLCAIFNDGSPLHDGAVIIRRGQILAAACRLPLSDNREIDSHFHMRHRAGIGVSEQSDCVALVVSEERGQLSAAIEGKVTKLSGVKELREFLSRELRGGLSQKSRRRRKTVEPLP